MTKLKKLILIDKDFLSVRRGSRLKSSIVEKDLNANFKEENKMRINHNISALNTNNQLQKNNGATSSSLAKLSSGLRINSAADDAAGLAISEKMRSQISGLDQAQRQLQRRYLHDSDC